MSSDLIKEAEKNLNGEKRQVKSDAFFTYVVNQIVGNPMQQAQGLQIPAVDAWNVTITCVFNGGLNVLNLAQIGPVFSKPRVNELIDEWAKENQVMILSPADVQIILSPGSHLAIQA